MQNQLSALKVYPKLKSLDFNGSGSGGNQLSLLRPLLKTSNIRSKLKRLVLVCSSKRLFISLARLLPSLSSSVLEEFKFSTGFSAALDPPGITLLMSSLPRTVRCISYENLEPSLFEAFGSALSGEHTYVLWCYFSMGTNKCSEDLIK